MEAALDAPCGPYRALSDVICNNIAVRVLSVWTFKEEQTATQIGE